MGREVSLEEIYDWLTRFMAEESCKRFEENVKFVFKIIFKHLKSEFQGTLIQVNSMGPDFVFYKYYFEDVSVRMGIDLSQFYDPLNYKTPHKTLTNEYIKLVLSSQRFKQRFHSYLASGRLKSSYQETIHKKIYKVLKRFDKLFEFSDLSAAPSAIEQIRRYFRSNRQCKLPWTEKEVDEAVESLMSLSK